MVASGEWRIIVKFYLVPIGEQFSFQGQAYTKSGPLTASAEMDGRSKMIPRSANVKLFNSAEPALQEAVKEKCISANDILTAVNSCHSECIEHLAGIQGEVSDNIFKDTTSKINKAYDKLIYHIKSLPQ